ncbi:MAG: diaminopimelate decarboxylase [Candidatus Sumerlaeaceae bacterium]|nr:diaminopimelate decarboxylase [Candidatus Sumerlaeaceae bacterium]
MTTSTAGIWNFESLNNLASRVGTPFWLVDAAALRRRIRAIKEITNTGGLQSRYAMKALSATRVLKEMREQGIWIDAVSGNEVLRALRAGFPAGNQPPVILLTADVFRDNALKVILDHGILPNIGSPGMVRQLADAGYNGPIAMRVNPGFGHGHVNACDTGGPSSKHGIWLSAAGEAADAARKAGLRVVMLHAHIGSGPKMEELLANLRRLAGEFARLATDFPDLEAISLGGGIPHAYKESQGEIDVTPLGPLFGEARELLIKAVGRDVRVEIEPGRFFVAPSVSLVTRVADVKKTSTNEKGQGQTFAMVDGGFVDLIRPAMYGSYHKITVHSARGAAPEKDIVVAGPLCESGDVFTRDSSDLLAPRHLPEPSPGDLLALHDAGAYGYAMSSNYNSIGRAPQVWLEEDGSTRLISRRETIEDILKAETDEAV